MAVIRMNLLSKSLGRQTNIMVCIINKTQLAELETILREYPNTFAVMSQVSEVMGNFKKLDNRGKIEKEFLDKGDGSGV